VPCLRAFRSSVPSNVPPAEHGKEDGAHRSAVAHALGGARPAGLGGRSQRARAVHASDLDGVGLDAGVGGTRRAGTSPELEPGT